MDELTEADLRELRADLGALEAELRRTLENSQDATRPVDLDEPIGRVSRIDAIQQQRMRQANRAAVQNRLQQTRAALARADEDAYGTCLSCGDGIGYARLKARPETPLCVGCQSRRERRH